MDDLLPDLNLKHSLLKTKTMHRAEGDSIKQNFVNGRNYCKELNQKCTYKKTNWIGKLVFLVILGLSGMYICISGVDRGVMYHKHSTELAITRKSRTKEACMKSETVPLNNIFVHYPQPSTYDRKECSCTPVHYFVLFSMQRSGSGWFETLLNSHPNVSSHGEIFSVDKRRESVLLIKKALDTLYNLDWVSSASKNECTTAVGLKWMLNQGVMEFKREIADYLQERSVSAIFLFRRNILKRYVSILANSFDRSAKQLNGTHRAHVHSEEEANILATYKPAVNLTSLVPYLQRVEKIMSDAESTFNDTRHLIIYYEDLISNPSQELRKAQEFLGVEPTKLESKHVKIHTRPLSNHVDNWSDLSAFLKGTRYEALLNESDYG